MTAAFIVTLNVDDQSIPGLTEDADSMFDALVRSGFDVEEVKPWARSSEFAPNLLTPDQPFPSDPQSGGGLMGPMSPFGN